MKGMDRTYQFYHELPTWAKGVTVCVVVGASLYVGSRLYKVLFPSKAEQLAREMAKNVDSEISKATSIGMKASYPDVQYMTFANIIYEGMKYTVSDDYATVADTLKKMNNDLDVMKLVKAFGSRQDYTFAIPEGSPKDLFTFVKSELGSEWGGLTSYRITSINDNWKKKGITYQI